MKRALASVVLCVGAVVFAQDRSLIVRESSVQVTGGDWSRTADGGCDAIARIVQLPNQAPPQVHRLPADVCSALTSSSTRAAKLDQRVGNGAKP